MTEPSESRVASLSSYCYQSISTNSDRITSLGYLPYRLASPILDNCTPEKLLQMEKNYNKWQQREYLDRTDKTIWKSRCMELLGSEGLGVYASSCRTIPDSWRKEYWALLKEQQSAVVKASDRVAKYRESVESDQRKTKRTLDLVGPKRRNGSNPLSAISNPAFRKVVAQTRKSYMGHSMGPNPQQMIQRTSSVGSQQLLGSHGRPPLPLLRQSTQVTTTSPIQYSPARSPNLFIPKPRP
ncbi:hypothetical protein CPB86DRAFT_873005 [Serendipita vermifera]|nr:hypothetical protein CPB86DRAFT_873005 [Serendipita vermifera]